jgi:hypothetical protein
LMNGLFRSFHTNWLCAQSKDWILLTLLAQLLERWELIVHSIGLIVSTWFSLPTRIIYTGRTSCWWLLNGWDMCGIHSWFTLCRQHWLE